MMIEKIFKNDLYSVFKQYFKSDIINLIDDKYNLIYLVNESRIRDISTFLNERNINLINISTLTFKDNFQLVYEYHFKLEKSEKFLFLILIINNNDSINSIDHIYPQAKYYENEIEKRYGFKFRSINDKEKIDPFTIPSPFEQENKSNSFIPTGIYNNNKNLRNYFNLFFKRNRVITISEKTGWMYRGILPLLTSRSFKENIKLTKKICYPSSYHHNLTYIMALEQLFDIQIQNRVKQVRTVFCELERFENLLSWFINLFNLLKHENLSMKLIDLRLSFQQSVQKHLKIRFFDDINFIGYCHDFPNGDLLNFQVILNNITKIALKIIKKAVYSNHLRNKCEGIGILKREDALNAGVTGPCLRASGIDHDIRFEKPYLSYMEADLVKEWDIVTSFNGDVFSRIETRAWEIGYPIKIIDQLLTNLIDDDNEIERYDDKNLILPKDKMAIMQVESPQGELGYYLKTSELGDPFIFAGACICTPSFKNFIALNEFILKGNNKSNFALIVHSMDLNFNEIDL